MAIVKPRLTLKQKATLAYCSYAGLYITFVLAFACMLDAYLASENGKYVSPISEICTKLSRMAAKAF